MRTQRRTVLVKVVQCEQHRTAGRIDRVSTRQLSRDETSTLCGRELDQHLKALDHPSVLLLTGAMSQTCAGVARQACKLDVGSVEDAKVAARQAQREG